jgi:phytoene dehydrogenase-like protein
MDPDVIVIGAGPNGLTAAAMLGLASLKVLVLEGAPTIGGAVKTAEVTRPGFKHDLFSGFYPLFPIGPIGQLNLERHGLTMRSFDTPFAGGTPTGPGVAVHRDPRDSALSFERAAAGDGRGYTRLWNWWTHGRSAVQDLLFNPLGSPAALFSARRLGSLAHLMDFARLSVGPAAMIAEEYFQGADARVWFIGSPLHSDLGTDDAGGGLYGLVMMGLAQQVGMPIPEGGAQAIPDALAGLIRSTGGEIRTGERVTRIHVRGGRAEAVETHRESYRARSAILATVTPPSLFLDLIERQALSAHFMKLVRNFRWGTGVFKVDFALSGLPDFNGAISRIDALCG